MLGYILLFGFLLGIFLVPFVLGKYFEDLDKLDKKRKLEEEQ